MRQRLRKRFVERSITVRVGRWTASGCNSVSSIGTHCPGNGLGETKAVRKRPTKYSPAAGFATSRPLSRRIRSALRVDRRNERTAGTRNSQERNNDVAEKSAARPDGRKDSSNLPVHFQKCQAANVRHNGNLLINAARGRIDFTRVRNVARCDPSVGSDVGIVRRDSCQAARRIPHRDSVGAFWGAGSAVCVANSNDSAG